MPINADANLSIFQISGVEMDKLAKIGKNWQKLAKIGNIGKIDKNWQKLPE